MAICNHNPYCANFALCNRLYNQVWLGVYKQDHWQL